MSKRTYLRLVPLVLSTTLLTGCIDELSQIFDIVLFSESDDPDVRKLGKDLAELRQELEARAEVDEFLTTGDAGHIDAALAIRPDDTEIHGFKVALAIRNGDAAALEAAKRALALAEARRLAALRRPGDPPTPADQIERNVLGEILVAQTRMLGGSLNVPWNPPPADAPAETQQLYADYCATRQKIMTEFDDSLEYIPRPPCS